MRLRLAALGAALVLPLVAGPALVLAPAHAESPTSAVHVRATCTHTSSGSCIRGGQFCPQASYGHVGYDASHRRYVCKGDRTHPHWML